MKVAGDVLFALATKLGIADNEGIKQLLASPELAKVQLPEEVANVFSKGVNGDLLTLAEAKQNEAIISHMKSKLLSQEESKLLSAFEGVLTPDELADLGKKPTLFNKIEVIRNGLADLRKQKQDASPAGKKEIELQIQAMQQELAAAKDESKALQEKHKAELASVSQRYEGELVSRDLASMLSGKKYTIDNADVHLLVTNKLNQKLKEYGAELVRTDAGLQLKKQVDGFDVTVLGEDKKPVSLNSLIDSFVSPYVEKAPAQNGQTPATQTAQTIQGVHQAQPPNKLAAQALAELQNGVGQS